MAGSRKRQANLEMGHDAFLDIVANLVGILIILVVVLGTQSQHVVREIVEEEVAEAATPAASDDQFARLAALSGRAAAAQFDSDRFEQQIVGLDQRISLQQLQRDRMLDLLAQAQAAWEDKQQELDRQAVEDAKQQTAVREAEQRLEQLRGQRERLQDREEPVVAVAHLPTPMAKTVFGDEVHFRLKDDRLSVVPIEALVEQIRQDFSRMAGSARSGTMDSAVGPLRGYTAKYAMSKNSQMVRGGSGAGIATRIQLVGMIIEPLEEPYGQPMDQVLAGRSQVDVELAGRDPNSTTITVWVYPDSFMAFRQLKEYLYRRGFATAARPLPTGYPIMGSPQGSRSNAQ